LLRAEEWKRKAECSSRRELEHKIDAASWEKLILLLGEASSDVVGANPLECCWIFVNQQNEYCQFHRER